MILLGVYSRWDDLKLSLRIQQEGMRRFAGEHTHVILVYPCDIFCLKKKAFEHAKEYLELQSIKVDCIAHLNLLDVCKKHEISSKWLTNDARHCNHRANALYADSIYDALKHIIEK